MEPLLVMKTASVLLAIAALGGLTLAVISFKKQPPAALAMLHGFLAGAAVTLLLYAYFTVGLPMLASWALLLFLLAALGGAYLNLGFHMKNLALPKGIIAAHAVLAVAGFCMLLIAAWGSAPKA